MLDDSMISGSLWFHDSNSCMQEQLLNSQRNAGVGIHVGKEYVKLLDLQTDGYVSLVFDDQSVGKAKVVKNKSGKCNHIISASIGRWARDNGLWARKIEVSDARVFLKIDLLRKIVVVSTNKT